MHNHDLTGGNEVNIWYLSLHEPRYVLPQAVTIL